MSNTDTLQKLASLIFPDVTDADTVESLEERFPERGLSEGAKVTRIAPSPTGSMHIGNLYGGLADERIAHSATKDGVFYLRIEDTDDKREVPGAVEKIIKYLGAFGIEFDEGASADGDIGAYGPYRQRARAKIYHIVAKKLLLDGRAYPCFCTEEDLQKAHAAQEAAKENFGYYGKWAIHRDMPAEEAIKRIENGESYVLRFRSMGDPTKKVEFKDQIKGKLSFPENDQDFVLLKSDGIPTYHFAHVVDDHFMRTTDVVRGEEWLSTLPWHVELWRACGFKMPRFCHTAQVMKLDEETGTKRKMSKRKDPECTLGFYFEKGYPAASVIEYLMTLLNSNYEQWRQANPTASYKDFPFKAGAMGNSGAMFDLAKFNDVSKNVIAHMTADEVYAFVAEWAKENDPDFYALISADAEYLKKFLAIGRGGKKPRKDFACWSEVKDFVSYMYDALFEQKDEYPAHVSAEDRNVLLKEYAALYAPEDDNNTWFEKVKNLSEAHGYTGDMKAYKATPEAFKGSVADVSNVIRVAITGRTNSPDLCSLMALLGKDRVTERLEKGGELLSKETHMNTLSLTIPASLAAKGVNTTPFVVKQLKELAENGGTLFFEPGIYHFYEDGALSGFFAPSNNLSGTKKVCFPILDAQNVTVDGGGSVFVFHGKAFPFIVSECSDITLKNFTCDTALPSVAAIKITEKNEEGFCAVIDKKKSPFRTENGHLLFELESGVLSTEAGKVSLHSLDRMNIKYLYAGDSSQDRTGLAAPFMDTDAFDLGDKIYFRYREDTQISCPFEVGERVVINLEEKRERAVFFFENSERVTVENVVIRRGGGMGVIAQMCTDITVTNMRTDKTAHGDSVTLTADAFHLVNCSGTFELSGCDMSSFLDDACNVHGVYTVLDRVNGDCLHVHLGHADQNYFCPYKACDRIVLIDDKTLEPVCEAIVKDVFFTSNDGMNLSVGVEFLHGADALRPGFFVENPLRMPDTLIHNNRFSDFPHFRLSGAGKIRFENNVVSDCQAAIYFYDLAAYWFESGRIHDAVVKQNRFINCNALCADQVIDIRVSGFDEYNAPPVHDRIEISDNTFEKIQKYAVRACGVKELVVKDNTLDGAPLDESKILHIRKA